MAKILSRTPPRVFSFQQVGELALLSDAVIRPVRWEEIDYALQLLLSSSHTAPPPTESHLEAFIQNAKANENDLSFQMVGHWKNQLRHACLCLPQAGSCAMIVTSPPCGYPDLTSPLFRLSVNTLRQSCHVVFQQGYSLLQMILDVVDEPRKQLVSHAGFRNLTDLIYMARLIRRGESHPVLSDDYTWLSYTSARHEVFKTAIQKTYVDSSDCPELESLRQPEDVIQGHLAAGHFIPELWKVLLHNGDTIGVLLQSPLKTKEAIDLTYMGLAPGYRGRSLGRLMLQEALACCLDHQYPLMTLAVDCRNRPAYTLYRKMGFQTLFRRAVAIYSDQWWVEMPAPLW